MAKRPPNSRWRRLPPVFRSGEHKLPDPGQEPQRIILYLPAAVLDVAEILAEKADVATVQDYCAGLLAQAIETERIRHHVAEVEAKRGPLEGLNQIANDPDYLAEWHARSEVKPAIGETQNVPGGITGSTNPSENLAIDKVDLVLLDQAGDHQTEEEESGLAPPAMSATVPVPGSAGANARIRGVAEIINETSSLDVLMDHVGPGESDPLGFLPSLRRGQSVSDARAAELIQTLNRLEVEHRGATVLDRRLAHALHRLALESQVLLTDAWPGIFDERVVLVIRSVQEAVERILSGQDIRYYPTPSSEPTAERLP